MWKTELQGDPDSLYILNELQHGFRIVSSEATPIPAAVPNYASMVMPAHHAAVQSQIAPEILQGNSCVASLGQPPATVSALGAVPKADSNRIRLIHDCSWPSGLAVNDYAADYKFCYQSLR